MLKVGEFARLAGVSTRLLRYYDKIGLLSPAFTDAETGYRYYQPMQLTRLQRILVLKDLGLNLEQIAGLLESHLELNDLRAMLRLKQLELQAAVEDAQARLGRLQAHLQLIEEYGSLDGLEIAVKPLPAQPSLQVASVLEGGQHVSQFFREIWPQVQATGLALGTPFTIYLRSFDPAAQRLMAEQQRLMIRVGWRSEAQLSSPLPLSGQHVLEAVTLPACPRAAVLVYHGSDETRGPIIWAMRRWIVAKGYRLAAPIREFYRYRGGRQPSASDMITEVQIPLQ